VVGRPNSSSARPAPRPTVRACGVKGEGIKAVGEVCQARKSVAGLTQVAVDGGGAQLGSGAAWHGGGRWWWSWGGGHRQ
jgi:hypothetical protein